MNDCTNVYSNFVPILDIDFLTSWFYLQKYQRCLSDAHCNDVFVCVFLYV
jgi:hypothetical protein